MSRRYYAIFDPVERDYPRNVLVVEREGDRVTLTAFDHVDRAWREKPEMLDHLTGERAADCVEVDEGTARRLAARLGSALPA